MFFAKMRNEPEKEAKKRQEETKKGPKNEPAPTRYENASAKDYCMNRTYANQFNISGLSNTEKNLTNAQKIEKLKK